MRDAPRKLVAGETLVLASHNEGKLLEFVNILAGTGIKVRPVRDFSMKVPEETASDFEGNARIKALAACKASGLPALADDSGFCIEALDGRPGIYSARFAREAGSLKKAFDDLQKEIMRLPHPAGNKASFVTVLCLAWPDGKVQTLSGECSGRVVFPPRGQGGHGYDPIFVPEGSEKTFGEMTLAEKNVFSHRGFAMRKFLSEWVASEANGNCSRH